MLVNKKNHFYIELDRAICKERSNRLWELIGKVAFGILIAPLFSSKYYHAVQNAYLRFKNAKHLTQDIVTKVFTAAILQRKKRYENALKQLQKKNPPLFQELKARPLMGHVKWIPGNFALWMPGIRLVASYLKEKHGLKNLHVCQTPTDFQKQLKQFAEQKEESKAVFIVSSLNGDPPDKDGNFPQHKSAVCVEKIDGKLSIALIDGMPKPIDPEKIKLKSHPGELIANCIRKANLPQKVDLYQLTVQRQFHYGCETLALRDALYFLRKENFFEGVKANLKYEDHNLSLWEIVSPLAPELLIGAQSQKLLTNYKNGKKWLHVNGKVQNHYITFKCLKYLDIALNTFKAASLSGQG